MAYSQDLRERVIAAVRAKRQSLDQIAETFGVSPATVDNWARRWRETRSVAALPWAGGVKRSLRDCGAVIRDELRKQPDDTLEELCTRVEVATGIRSNPSMMCRELQRLDLPRKKKTVHDNQRDTPRVKRERRAFVDYREDELLPVLERLHFLDEFGAHLGMTRSHGRAAPGKRVVEATPDYSGPHYTVVATISLAGVAAPWVIEGSMDGTAFATYAQHELGPSLQAGDVVVIDNLSAHKNMEAQTSLEARGVQVVFLPPYSSDFNPIELCWAKVKQALRSAKARTFDALLEALRSALLSVSPEHVKAWFAHCGYVSA